VRTQMHPKLACSSSTTVVAVTACAVTAVLAGCLPSDTINTLPLQRELHLLPEEQWQYQ
jgi:hypothetical protein